MESDNPDTSIWVNGAATGRTAAEWGCGCCCHKPYVPRTIAEIREDVQRQWEMRTTYHHPGCVGWPEADDPAWTTLNTVSCACGMGLALMGNSARSQGD